MHECIARMVKDKNVREERCGGTYSTDMQEPDAIVALYRTCAWRICDARRLAFGPRRKPLLLNYPLNTTAIRRVAPAPFQRHTKIQCNLGKISRPIKSGAHRSIFVREREDGIIFAGIQDDIIVTCRLF